MEVIGYLASALIGVSLGLIGGGGSIITVPVLVYLFAVSPTLAISYSLFIVGITSTVGAIKSYRHNLVDVHIVLLFGAVSITTVFIARKFIIPLLPNVFFTIGTFRVTHSLFVMVVFAILMVMASLSMIKDQKPRPGHPGAKKPGQLVLYGLFIGAVTGLLGAGGGFLLIPALVLLMKLPMKKAVGTSLVIIALNSSIGFLGDIGHHVIDWALLISVSAIAIIGIFVGGYYNKKIDSGKLRKGFGWFVMVMGMYIILKEIMKF